MSTESTKYRLLTRSDFDGLVCAILLKELGILGSIEFVHPKDVQDGKITVTGDDILTNLPYAPGCHYASTITPAKKSGPAAWRPRITSWRVGWIPRRECFTTTMVAARRFRTSVNE